jgi:hypothetical protein
LSKGYSIKNPIKSKVNLKTNVLNLTLPVKNKDNFGAFEASKKNIQPLQNRTNMVCPKIA